MVHTGVSTSGNCRRRRSPCPYASPTARVPGDAAAALRADELVIVDYKTGRQPPTPDDARGSLTLALYAVATERTLRLRCRQVELHHVPSGRIVEWRHTDDSLSRHMKRAAALAAEADGADHRWRDGLSRQEADEVFPARA